MPDKTDWRKLWRGFQPRKKVINKNSFFITFNLPDFHPPGQGRKNLISQRKWIQFQETTWYAFIGNEWTSFLELFHVNRQKDERKSSWRRTWMNKHTFRSRLFSRWWWWGSNLCLYLSSRGLFTSISNEMAFTSWTWLWMMPEVMLSNYTSSDSSERTTFVNRTGWLCDKGICLEG